MTSPRTVNLLQLPDSLDELEWEDHSSHGRQGARIHYLFRDEARGHRVALVHCRPGTHAKPHRHAGHESILVLEGGFPPSTQGNPRPYGMPPFATVLSTDEVAELLSYVRGSWGNRAAPVSALEVARLRGHE